MAVSQARLDRYRADVDAHGDAAATYVEEYLSALIAENPGAPISEIRDEAIAAIDDSLNAFGDQASTLALDLLEELADSYGVSVETAIEDVIPSEMVDGGVRYAARRLVEGDSPAFTRDVADLSRYYVHRSAFENMERNCDRNDLRYARVPSGRETCGFCFMLSSRGFVYRSEDTAGSTHAYHDHCDCVIVPGFKDLPASEQVEGYDPDEMRDRWHDCQKTVGTDSELRERWKSMTDKQRARYKGKTDGERYRRFVNAQAIREAETRDFRWLNTGEIPQIDYALNPRSAYGTLVVPNDYSAGNIVGKGNEWRDLFALDTLQGNGFALATRPPKAVGRDGAVIDGVTCPDLTIGDEIWEIKSPPPSNGAVKEGNELDYIGQQLRRANHSFSNPYDPESMEGMGDYSPKRAILNLFYRPSPVPVSSERFRNKLAGEMRRYDIDEVIVIDADGALRRFFKQ